MMIILVLLCTLTVLYDIINHMPLKQFICNLFICLQQFERKMIFHPNLVLFIICMFFFYLLIFFVSTLFDFICFKKYF